MDKILEIASRVSTPLSLGGLIAAILFLILRQILAKKTFPRLTKVVGGQIIILIINRLFWLAIAAMILGFVAYILTGVRSQTSNVNAQRDPDRELEYAGQVVDTNGDPIYGALIQIRDEKGSIQVKRTDSAGRYQYSAVSSITSVCIMASADKHEKKERCLSPTQTGREPIILPDVMSTPSPIVGRKPISPRLKKPCTAEDRLLGKC